MGTKLKTWFISDTHFSHASILRFHPARREAAGITLEELQKNKIEAEKKHDKWLIDLWNKTIGKHDFVYILGDFCLGSKEYTEKILSRLNGRKYLILGNHDKSIRGLERYFEWIGESKTLKFNHNQYDFIPEDEHFTLQLHHTPEIAWVHRPYGACHLHGHTHGSMDEYNENSKELRIDAGLDGKLANYNFIELEKLYSSFVSIREKYGNKTFREHTEMVMNELGFKA